MQRRMRSRVDVNQLVEMSSLLADLVGAEEVAGQFPLQQFPYGDRSRGRARRSVRAVRSHTPQDRAHGMTRPTCERQLMRTTDESPGRTETCDGPVPERYCVAVRPGGKLREGNCSAQNLMSMKVNWGRNKSAAAILYLDPLDQEMATRGHEETRYAHDFIIQCRTQAEAEMALEVARQIVAELGLRLHPEKTRIVESSQPGGFEFLSGTLSEAINGLGKRACCAAKKRLGNKLGAPRADPC